jgi:transcriptional regulator with XRE-family HTH domain
VNRGPDSIAVFVKEAATRQGVSLRHLAAMAKMSPDTLYRMMNNDTRSIGILSIYRLARAMGIAPIALLRVMYHDIELGPATDLPVEVQGDHIAFVSDITYPDGAVVKAGQRFVKCWLLQNTGRVAWRNRVLACMDSEIVVARKGADGVLVPLFAPGLKPVESSVAVPDTQPGGTAEISVEFVAPMLPCDTLSLWKMKTAKGTLSFPEHSGIWCRVSVMAV